MIKNVIFDIGMVLINFDWDSYIRGYFDEKTAEIVSDATWHSADWCKLDLGVPFDEVMECFIANAPEYEEQIRFIIEHIGECPERQKYAIPWVKELKAAGYNVYYLSNFFEYLVNAAPQVLDFRAYMDGGVFSYQEGIIKPDHAIYQLICDRYGLEKSECLFIDDSEKNVVGAREFGMNAFRFEGYEKNYREIMEIIGFNK